MTCVLLPWRYKYTAFLPPICCCPTVTTTIYHIPAGGWPLLCGGCHILGGVPSPVLRLVLLVYLHLWRICYLFLVLHTSTIIPYHCSACSVMFMACVLPLLFPHYHSLTTSKFCVCNPDTVCTINLQHSLLFYTIPMIIPSNQIRPLPGCLPFLPATQWLMPFWQWVCVCEIVMHCCCCAFGGIPPPSPPSPNPLLSLSLLSILMNLPYFAACAV